MSMMSSHGPTISPLEALARAPHGDEDVYPTATMPYTLMRLWTRLEAEVLEKNAPAAVSRYKSPHLPSSSLTRFLGVVLI